MVSITVSLAVLGCGTIETARSRETDGAEAELVEEHLSLRELETAEQTGAVSETETLAKQEKAVSVVEAQPEREGAGLNMENEKAQDIDMETADSAVQNMRIGWNLGNALDATGSWISQGTAGSVACYETAWGNPLTPPTLMPKLKSMGFGAVRIPITWNYHFDQEGSIDAEWMARVKEIVDWAMEADLYCIINIHHDTGADGWLRASTANYDQNNLLYAKLWEQIATEFKDYPQLLVFEGFNEMLDENSEWSNPGAEAVRTVNRYNQLFVDTVRGTGGNNEKRNLVCCTYAAAMTDAALGEFVLPKDSAEGHLIAEVHFYTPYEFITDEGVTWTTPVKAYTDSVERQMDEAFLRLSKKFTEAGVPLIIGEFASDDKDNTDDRLKWYTHVIEKANEIDVSCFIWDNGNGFCMGNIDRVGDGDSFPQIIEACVKASE